MLDKLKASWQAVKEKIVTTKVEPKIKKVFGYCRWFNMQLTTAFDITTVVHWSVPLVLLIMLFFSPFQAQMFFIALLSIVPHEYGHALAAKYYGVKTKRIVIYPIGGIAMLEANKAVKIQEKVEFVITLAGPLVTLGLAALGFFMVILHGVPIEQPPKLEHFGFWFYFFAVNAGLFLFNLLPAFPMDGGRLLRSVLSYKFDHVTSTKYAYWCSVACCCFLMGVGIVYGKLNLIIIMFLILQMAREEYMMVKRQKPGLLEEAIKVDEKN